MKIISHRGYWLDPLEKNTKIAFLRSFDNNFGIETDLRDYGGKIVIAHDMPMGKELSFEDLIKLVNESKKMITLALNIKSDGLAPQIFDLIKALKYKKDIFFFDMSIPDMRAYLKLEMPVFTRFSEVEQNPVWLDLASGVWIDGFEIDSNLESIERMRSISKKVCLVSPELHGRPYEEFWKQLKVFKNDDNLTLCTDYPEKARDYFES